MTKRKKFKEHRESGLTLESIAKIIQVSLKTIKRWNKELKEGTLIRKHGLVGKKGNKTTTINLEKLIKLIQ